MSSFAFGFCFPLELPPSLKKRCNLLPVITRLKVVTKLMANQHFLSIMQMYRRQQMTCKALMVILCQVRSGLVGQLLSVSSSASRCFSGTRLLVVLILPCRSRTLWDEKWKKVVLVSQYLKRRKKGEKTKKEKKNGGCDYKYPTILSLPISSCCCWLWRWCDLMGEWGEGSGEGWWRDKWRGVRRVGLWLLGLFFTCAPPSSSS